MTGKKTNWYCPTCRITSGAVGTKSPKCPSCGARMVVAIKTT